MLRYILFLVNAGTVLAGINIIFEGHVLIGSIVGLIGFVGLLLLPEQREKQVIRRPSYSSMVRCYRHRGFQTEHVPVTVQLPIEWEEAMAAKAPPLDPLFFDAIKRG